VQQVGGVLTPLDPLTLESHQNKLSADRVEEVGQGEWEGERGAHGIWRWRFAVVVLTMKTIKL